MAHNVSIASDKANRSMMERSDLLPGPELGADPAIDLKQPGKNDRPGVAFTDALRRHPAILRELNTPRLSCHGVGERRYRILFCPVSLNSKNNPIHVATANPDNGCCAGLTFQGGQAECLLHAGMHEQICGSIEPRELLRVGAILHRGDIPNALLEMPQFTAQ